MIYHLTKKQSSALRLLTNEEDLSLMFGGGKGGGKTVLFCLWVDHWVERLRDIFQIKYDPTKSPLPVGFIGRKRGVDFHRTTLETFKRFIPSDHYRIKEQQQEIIFFKALKVFYGGLDDQERIAKFNSAEFALIGIDQAEETERTDVDILQATLRLTYNGIKPPYKQLYTSNPADCWLKEDFIDNKLHGKYFVPALYTDNPYLPENYSKTLDDAFRYNQSLLRAYKFGDWYSLQAENALISGLMLANLKEIKIYPKYLKRIVSCDPSLGGDEGVIQIMENHKILEQLILHERDTMKIAGHMITLANKYHCPNYDIDTIGIGQGIADRIRELHPNARVNYINSSAESVDSDRFYNLRAEMWWYVMMLIQDRKIPYPEDEEIRSQLCSMRFKVVNSNGKIQLEAKEQTKKRIGRSPDRADAFVMGLWALDQTEPIKHKDGWRDEGSHHEVGSGATSAMTA